MIFVSERTDLDAEGYAAAAAAMETLAKVQPGYRGFETVRGENGPGITLSYWADEASAIAWRDQPDHAEIRALGRSRWYSRYEVIVATVDRAYAWAKG